jgi:hypothetical protein
MNKLVVNEVKPARNNSRNPWNSALSLEKRWEYFCAQFKELDIRDFSRSYTDRKVTVCVPNEQEIDAIFTDMRKDTKESRHVDCSCCGYHTCRDMVNAIYNGVNKKENCIYYIKALAEQEKDEIESFHRENVNEQNIRNDKLHHIKEQFEQLNDGINELSNVNNVTAEDAGNVAQVVREVT